MKINYSRYKRFKNEPLFGITFWEKINLIVVETIYIITIYTPKFTYSLWKEK